MNESAGVLYRKLNILISALVAAAAVLLLAGVIGFILLSGRTARLARRVNDLQERLDVVAQENRLLAEHINRSPSPAATRTTPATSAERITCTAAAEILSREGSLSESRLQALRGRLAAREFDGEGAVALAEAFLAAGEPEQALRWAEAVIEAGGVDQALRIRAGAAAGASARALERYEVAAAHLQAAVEQDPDQPRLRLALAETLGALGQWAPAAENLLAVARIEGDSAELWIRAAELAERAEMGREALDAWTRAHELDGSAEAPAQRVAAVALAQGRPDRASAILQAAMGPERSPRLLALLGAAREAQGLSDAALEAWRESLELAPAQPELWLQIGLIHARRLEHDQAAEALGQALALAPERAQAWYALAVVDANRGRVDQALSHATRAVELEDDFADAQYLLAVLHARRGNADAALTALRAALAGDASYAVAAAASEDFAALAEQDPRFAELLETGDATAGSPQ